MGQHVGGGLGIQAKTDGMGREGKESRCRGPERPRSGASWRQKGSDTSGTTSIGEQQMWLSPAVGMQVPLAEGWVCGRRGSAH